MPRVRVTSRPSPDQVAAHPREFAVWTLVSKNGDAADVTELAQYGDKEAVVKLSGDASFDEVAAALKRSGTPVDGEGNAVGYAARDPSGHLSPYKFSRRQPTDDDVEFQIMYCGICHSDLHTIRSEWGTPKYPIIPGHELVGIVTKVGSNAKGFEVGQRVGVGCFVDACRNCEACAKGEDQYCPGMVQTYNMTDKYGQTTQGGYSTHFVVDHRYLLHIPDNLPLDAAAPLLCAGITTYSPLRYYGLDKPGLKIGVVGLGGLGHMAVKLAKAMGAEVTVLSTSASKEKEAREGLKADHFVVSKDKDAMQAHANSLDGILDTVSAKHPLEDYIALLKTDGKLILLGAPPEPHSVSAFSLLMKRKMVGGSLIGGIKETQEMLDFCSKHNITCDIERIDFSYVNTAMDRLVKNDVHYRFVIDVAGSLVCA